MNDTEGNIASYLHEMYHKVFAQGQITDFLQTAERRQGMDAIDRFAKSKAFSNVQIFLLFRHFECK